MTDQDTTTTQEEDMTARQRAIEAYEDARDRATDTLGQAPLLALAGGLAAGALIAALLPRTDAETRVTKSFADRLRVFVHAVGDRQHRDLYGSQPQRERTGVVLDQDRDETLE